MAGRFDRRDNRGIRRRDAANLSPTADLPSLGDAGSSNSVSG